MKAVTPSGDVSTTGDGVAVIKISLIRLRHSSASSLVSRLAYGNSLGGGHVGGVRSTNSSPLTCRLVGEKGGRNKSRLERRNAIARSIERFSSSNATRCLLNSSRAGRPLNRASHWPTSNVANCSTGPRNQGGKSGFALRATATKRVKGSRSAHDTLPAAASRRMGTWAL